MTNAAWSVPPGTSPPAARRRSDPVRQRGRLALQITFGVIGLLGVAGLVALTVLADAPAGMLVSVIYGLIPLPLLWMSYWWLDRYEPEPRRYLAAAFVWGAVVSTSGAVAIEGGIGTISNLGDEQMATFIAPIVEEPLKIAFLLLTSLRARRVIDGLLDGIIYSGLVGIGFAFTENILYYMGSYVEIPRVAPISGVGAASATFIVRGIFSPFAHPLFTTAFGIALGLAVTRKSWWAKLGLLVVGLLSSFLLHGLWNGSATFGGGSGFLLMYVSLAVVGAAMAALAITLRLRQGRALQTSLEYVARRRWIHPDEVPYLSGFNLRAMARKYARTKYGKSTATAVGSYQRCATEMAFLHDRVMRGNGRRLDVERTYALLNEMAALRPYVRLPPPIPRRWSW